MKLPPLVLASCLALAIAVGGCGGSDSESGSSEASTAAESTGSTESAAPSENALPKSPSTTEEKKPVTTDKTKPKVTVPKGVSPDDFAVRDLEEGSGVAAKKGDTVTIQYVGVGYESKKEIASSWNPNEPYTFVLGGGEVLKGGEQGIEGMKAGGRREMVIPGDLAYGSKGAPPNIAPNETLIFVIDLLAVE